MKILHIYKDYYPVMGGIENYVKTLAESQKGQGHDITVLATSLSGKTTLEMINGVLVIKSARIAKISSTPLSFSLFKWIRRLDADITHLHFPYPVGEFAHLFLGRSSHTVITYHSDIVKQKITLLLYMPFLRWIMKKADCVLATSPQYIETSPYLKTVRDKCVVVPLGTDISRFQRPDKRMSAAIRKENGNSFILLFVGRLRYFKGLKYLVEAMKSVDGKLLIIGTGPEEKALKDKVTQDKLGGKITFLGDVAGSDLPAYYDACDVFVLPSSHRSEAFGTVLIEAMASGKPVISTELGTGTSYVNIHGLTGFVVPPRDPASLVNAINRLLSDDSIRKEFSLNSRKRAEEFTNDVLNKRVLEIYEKVMSVPSEIRQNQNCKQGQI